MDCVYCGEPYDATVGCCNEAAISIALVALNYHADCECEEVKNAKAQLLAAMQRTHGMEL